MTTSDISELFKEAMLELRDIKKELVSLNTNMEITTVRLSMAVTAHEDLKAKVVELENRHANCPARQSHSSFSRVGVQVSSILAFVLAVAAVLQMFYQSTK